ncbi:MAG: endonuclease/exonuclease/phosphatase family protein [Prevotellaceae bacterium]|nr:endonuclease/exonuclease/phosphatase family protein [Prevotellaceae bacterium]
MCTTLVAVFSAKAQNVSCTPSRIVFTGSIAAGQASAAQSFTATATNLKGNITVQPSSQVQISLTGAGSTYSNLPVIIPAGELAGGKAIYVRFAPTCSGFPDSVVDNSVIFLNQNSELLGSMTITGIVHQESATGGQPLKVATFNAEWLGCPNNGPEDKSLQMRNVATIISRMDADIVGLQEIVDNPTKSIDTVLAHLGSTWGGYVLPHSKASCAQSEAVIYKKNRITLVGTPLLLSNAGDRNAWSSGRYPVEFNFDVSADNRNIPITIINLHAKAFSDATSYERRVKASQGLKTLLDGSSYSAQNLIVLGDFNDDIDVSTYKKSTSPYKNFVDDSINYRFLTTSISASISLIDHIMISSNLFPYYKPGSTQREVDVANSVPSYSSTTSDHLPVSAVFAFGKMGQELPVPDLYTVNLTKTSTLDMPVYSTGSQPVSYAIDSGAIASLNKHRVTFFDTGMVRMVAWQPGNMSYTPAAKFFYVRVTSSNVAPQIAVQPTGQSVALRETAVFSVHATGTELRYQWKKNGMEIAGATSFCYVVSKANNPHIGYYSCTVSNGLGSVESQAVPLCVNTSCPTQPTAVKKNTFEGNIKVYPNPVQRTLFVESASDNIAEVRIYNASGIMVYERQSVHAAALSIDTHGLGNGFYVVVVVSDRGEKAVKTLTKY